MAADVVGFCEMRLRGPGMVQRMRGVQRRRASGAGDNSANNKSNCPNPRQHHQVIYPFSYRFLIVRLPRAAHLLPVEPMFNGDSLTHS